MSSINDGIGERLWTSSSLVDSRRWLERQRCVRSLRLARDPSSRRRYAGLFATAPEGLFRQRALSALAVQCACRAEVRVGQRSSNQPPQDDELRNECSDVSQLVLTALCVDAVLRRSDRAELTFTPNKRHRIDRTRIQVGRNWPGVATCSVKLFAFATHIGGSQHAGTGRSNGDAGDDVSHFYNVPEHSWLSTNAHDLGWR